jgi:hypothetical protein
MKLKVDYEADALYLIHKFFMRKVIDSFDAYFPKEITNVPNRNNF